MAPAEMKQTGPPLSLTQPTTPPSSPNLPFSEHILTSNNIQQFIDMVGAVVAMQIASPSVSKSTCSHKPAETPTLQGPAQPLTFEHLEQLFSKLLEGKVSNSIGKSEDTQALAPEANQPEDVAPQASKLEFKIVDEVWNEKAHKYTILKSLDPMGKAKEKDLYVFVVRHRVDRETKDTTTYIDIKSKCLRDILRVVLQDVRGISLKEDKLSIEQNLLYTYLPELKSYHSSNNVYPADDTCQQHLELFIDCIAKAYVDVAQHLTSLLQSGQITYDLLWALFKPNTFVYTTCSGTRKPRCVRFNFGEEKKTRTGTKYWSLDCRYLDFNGEDFGSTPIELKIPKFRGTRQINILEAFPLQYHANVKGVRADLLACGRKFMSIMGSHHRYCRGKAFVMCEGEQVEVAVDSRIMVDAAFFRKMNPGRSMPTIELDLAFAFDLASGHDFWDEMHPMSDASSDTSFDRALSDASSVLSSNETTFDVDLDPNDTAPDQAESHLADFTEEDFLICCPTVPGFSFGDKMWAEFAVADIEDIAWSSLPFDSLAIAKEQRDVVMALVESRNDPSVKFDDVIAGKGQGLNILLHGLPGVGKTLTAEAVAEFLKLPLYSISAGELSIDAAKLEAQLSRIFMIAGHWEAILLLDEADVFLEKRSSDLSRNSVVSVFLRKLEYSQGIMFLTTNRVAEFDQAILSRIHVMLRYGDLTKDAGKKVWELFIKKASTSQGPANISVAELEKLVNCKLNGRQIKNVMATARALAVKDKSRVRFSHIQKTVTASKEFITEFNGGVEVSRLYM